MKIKPIVHTPAVDRLINDAMSIESQTAQDAGSLGFMARALVQATLPHSKVVGNEFVRRNGNYTLTMIAPSAIGLPYGVIPRLLLAWMTTEAVKTQSRDIELGDSLSAFMAELGMIPTGGRWGSITRLKDQTKRLFGSMISASYEDKHGIKVTNQSIAEHAVLWWDTKIPEQAALWKSTVRLSEPFFREVIDRPIPIDMRALQALKKSPLALDIYVWLTYRASYLKSPMTIQWDSLAMQFGSDYARTRDFRAAFLAETRKVLTVYSDANVMPTDEGLVIKPMLTHVGKKK
jgi:Plasmid encoded RepA protein